MLSKIENSSEQIVFPVFKDQNTKSDLKCLYLTTVSFKISITIKGNYYLEKQKKLTL